MNRTCRLVKATMQQGWKKEVNEYAVIRLNYLVGGSPISPTSGHCWCYFREPANRSMGVPEFVTVAYPICTTRELLIRSRLGSSGYLVGSVSQSWS